MNKTLYIVLLLLIFGCKQEKKPTVQEYALTGETMGTTYVVKYVGEKNESLQNSIDSLLKAVNQSVSTYIPTSSISKVNSAAANVSTSVDKHFVANYKMAAEIYENTEGAFNPAIMPLVNYYGFGFEKFKKDKTIDTAQVKLLRELCHFSNFSLDNNQVIKSESKSQLDFSAIAKGYGVDEVSRLLIKKGLDNFLVEIGGEGYAQGLKANGDNWRFGIRRPSSANRAAFVKATPIDKRGIATSGNYENYRQLENSKVIGHTIDPKTGFAQSLEESLLSVTVIANNCMTADGYATAFKAMGLEQALYLSKQIPDIELFFIYQDSQGEIGTYSTLKE